MLESIILLTSSLTQLLLTFSTIHQAVDNKEEVDMVYLDFKKAFDSVPHNELLYKLWRVGVTGNLWCWFQSYLNDRSHYVMFDNAMSVLSGVPQGSILGPLLFILYVNDIPDTVNHSHSIVPDWMRDHLWLIRSWSILRSSLLRPAFIDNPDPFSFPRCDRIDETLQERVSLARIGLQRSLENLPSLVQSRIDDIDCRCYV